MEGETKLKRGADEWSREIGAEFASQYRKWQQTHCQDCFALLLPNSGTHTCVRNPTTVKGAIMQEFLRIEKELMPDESAESRHFALIAATSGFTTRLLAKRTQHRASADRVSTRTKKPKL